MANFFDGVVNALKHPFDEAQFLFDVGRGKIDLKDAPGEHQRMMNKITVPILGDNKIAKNSDAIAGAVVGSIFAAPVVGGAMSSGGSGVLGGSEFATGSFGGGQFGNIDFGGSSFPSFGGGAPTQVPEFGAGPEFGGWKPTTPEIGDAKAWYEDMNQWGELFGDVGKFLSSMDSGGGSSQRVGAFKPGRPQTNLSLSAQAQQKVIDQQLVDAISDNYMLDTKMSGPLSKGSIKDLLKDL